MKLKTSLAALPVALAMLSLPALAAEAPGRTLANLQTAFEGESNAHARYLAFAKKAEQEAYPQAGRLFRAAARAEQIHARNHAEVIRKLGGTPKAEIAPADVKSTPENLQAALAGESYERDSMYPGFLSEARQAGQAEAIRTLNLARNAEIEHAKLYQAALTDLEAMRQPAGSFYVCGVCGYTTMTLPAERCPSSYSPKEKFERID